MQKMQHHCAPSNIDIDILVLTIFLPDFTGLGLTTKLNC